MTRQTKLAIFAVLALLMIVIVAPVAPALLFELFSRMGQHYIVSGKVVDESGQDMPGVLLEIRDSTPDRIRH